MQTHVAWGINEELEKWAHLQGYGHTGITEM